MSCVYIMSDDRIVTRCPRKSMRINIAYIMSLGCNVQGVSPNIIYSPLCADIV